MFFAQSLYGQTHYTPSPLPVYRPLYTPPPPVVHEKKDKILIDYQYYELDTEGLRSYMENVKKDRPDLYATLNPNLEQLESDYSTGRNVLWGSLGIAALLAVQGYSVTMSESQAVVDDPDKEMSDTGTTLMVAGVACMTIGVLVHNFIIPDRKDYLNFINKHNAQKPKSPIQVTASLNPYKQSFDMSFNYVF